jgi:hypothetical protein
VDRPIPEFNAEEWRETIRRWLHANGLKPTKEFDSWTPYGAERWQAGLKPSKLIDYDVLDLTPEDIKLLKGMKIGI